MVTCSCSAPHAIGQLTFAHDGDSIVIHGPSAPDVQPRLVAADPDVVREAVRFDDAGRYRPLSGARSLPSNVSIRCTTPEEATEVAEAVYPLATHHRDAWRRGDLVIVPLDAVLSRQSGRYGAAASLGEAGRRAATAALCESECVRVPLWDGARPGPHDIPCPEPCSVLVSLCREAALWERDGAPPPAPEDVSVPVAAFDRPGNALRERYLTLRAEMED